MSPRFIPHVCAALILLSGCGTQIFGGTKPCAPVAAREGISLDIEPPFASRVAAAAVKVCWKGTCRSPRVELMKSYDTVDEGCEGKGEDAACSARRGEPTGELNGFADLNDLPGERVRVDLVLRDDAGRTVLDEHIDVTPRRPKMDSGTCGPGKARQTGIVVADGRLRERP